MYIDADTPITETFVFSGDGQTIFWYDYRLDLNLNDIGACRIETIACSPGNVYLSTKRQLYSYVGNNTIIEYPTEPVGGENDILFLDDNTFVLKRRYESQEGAEFEYTTFSKVTIN